MIVKDLNAGILGKLTLAEGLTAPELEPTNYVLGCIADDTLLASAAIWVNGTPGLKGKQTATIGNLQTSSLEAGQKLLEGCAEFIDAQNIPYALGPMNGTTWQSYRLIENMGERAPFFLEYITPDYWPGMFKAAGFEKIESYRSAAVDPRTYHDPTADRFAASDIFQNLTIRNFDPAKAEEDIKKLYDFSCRNFADNVLYTDIPLEQFTAQYQKVLPIVVPDFFILAEDKNKELAGFVFGIPDYLQKQSGGEISTLILKTLARDKDKDLPGLGAYLAANLHARAAKAGLTEVIHALMHDDNRSRTMSDKTAGTIRTYGLYAKAFSQ